MPVRTEAKGFGDRRGFGGARVLAAAAVLLVLTAAALGGSAQADPGDIGFPGPSATGAAAATTGEKPESKLWWNDGSWWASMYDVGTADYYIWRLNLVTATWQRTNTRLDDRPGTHADVLWDQGSGKLYVASHAFSESQSSGDQARLYRYTYNTATDTYTPDAGFPVVIHNYKLETTVIDKDSTGQLWATWVQGGKVWVNHTICNPTCNDASWGTPYVHPDTVSNSVTSDDISSLVTFANNRVGLMWSDQGDDTMYFSIRLDSAGDTTWQTKQIALGGPGTNLADDHINLKSLHADTGDRVYAAVKTSKTGNDPLNVLLRYDLSANTWSSAVFGVGNNDHTRPQILLDTTSNLVHMFATADAGHGGGAIYRKTSPMNGTLSFTPSSGLGEKVLWDASSDMMNNVTSTKQTVNATTGIVIMAIESGDKRYWWNYLPLDGSPPPNAAPASVDDEYATRPDTALVVPAPGVLGNDSDGNGDPLTAAKTSEPTHGTVALNANGGFTYTPATGFTGTDSFTYRASDGTVRGNVATVTISVSNSTTTTVNPVDDAYVRSGAPTENNGSKTTLTVYKTNQESYLKFVVPALGGTVTNVTLRLFVDGASTVGGTLYPVGDDSWSESTLNWNNKPAAGASAIDSVGTTSAGQWVELDLAGFVTGPGTYSFVLKTGSTTKAVYSSSEGANPPELQVTSGGSPAANRAPTAVNDTYAAVEDTALVVTAPGVLDNDTDPDGNPLTAAKTSNPAHGTVAVNANGSFTYTPTAGYTGPDSFTYKASDGTAESADATVDITVSPAGSATTTTVTPVDDAYVRSGFPTENNGSATTLRVYRTSQESYLKFVVPALGGPVTQAKLRLFVNQASTVGGTLYEVADNSWSESTLIWNNKPAAGTSSLGSLGSVTLNQWVELDLTGDVTAAGTYSFVLKTGNGTAAWYSSSEGANPPELVVSSGGSPPANQAPTAGDDSYSTPQNTALVVSAPGVLANDNDPDGNPITAVKTSDPASGTVTLNATGSFTYTPSAVFTGTDSFTYKASDGTAQSANATVTIDVTAGGGGAGSVTVLPTKDTYVRSAFPTENNGTAATLRSYTASGKETRSYLSFTVSGLSGTLTSATLRLFVKDPSAVGGDLYGVPDSSWGETTLTWSTNPLLGSLIISIGNAALNTWVEIDVGSIVTGNGTYSFAVTGVSNDVVYYSSKEGTNPPELVLVTT